MADVNDVRRIRDRGQMLLVAAFGVAVMLVALALILNTSIYTENIATRGSDISGGKDAARYQAATQTFVEDTIVVENYNNNSTADANLDYGSLRRPIQWSVWNYSNMSGRQQAVDSVVTRTTLKRQSDGTRIYQQGGADFDNKAADGNWTVVENTDGVRDFSISAPQTSLGSKNPGDPPVLSDSLFFVNVSDPDDDEWYRIYLYDDSTQASHVAVEVESHLGTADECSEDAGDSNLDVDITGATLEGRDCPALRMLDPIYDDDLDVGFNNTDDISEEYTMVVNSSYTDPDVHVNDDDTVRPYKTRGIYSVTVYLVYESKRLTVETDIRAAPGEFDG